MQNGAWSRDPKEAILIPSPIDIGDRTYRVETIGITVFDRPASLFCAGIDV
jgi:hypothetical protein